MEEDDGQILSLKEFERGNIANALALYHKVHGKPPFCEYQISRELAYIMDDSFVPRAAEGRLISRDSRVCASARLLWGLSYTGRLAGSESYTDISSSHSMLLMVAAIERSRLVELASAGIERVQVFGGYDSEDAKVCIADSDVIYRLQDAPELPHCVATGDKPCSCMFLAAPE